MKRFLSALLAAMMLCALLVPASLAKGTDPIPGYDKAGAKAVTYLDATKADADSMSVKIPSNAHYDVLAPTVYFDWDAKQKDDGYLTVLPGYFDKYESLTIVVKASSEYRKAVVTAPGTYLINKFVSKGKVHNINMVWIGDFVERRIPVYQRDFVISNGADIALGATCEGQPADIASVLDTYYDGSTAGLWESTLSGAFPELYAAMKAILLDYGDENADAPEFIWNNAYFTDSALAVSGATVVFEKKFTTLDTFTDSAYNALADDAELPLYIAGDNALLVFVNGKFVGQSSSVVKPYALESYDAGYLYGEIVGDRTEPYILGNDWRTVYKFDLRPYLLAGAENTVTIIGVNEAADAFYGPADDYAREPGKNPAGFMFSFEMYSMSVE